MGKLPTPTSPICFSALTLGSLFGVTSTILCVLMHAKYLDEVHLEHLDVHEHFKKSTQKVWFSTGEFSIFPGWVLTEIPTLHLYVFWVFPKIGVFPPNHPLKNKVFHYFHHPFWGIPIFWKHPFGEMIQFDEHIFEMGWFNHQLVVS